MPFVSGSSLRERLDANGGKGLGLAEYVGILRDVARALAFAHREKVVHRDIKPGNILLAGNSAAVTDFGIAKAIATARAEGSPHLTQTGSSLGTPAYMAPEQAAADPDADHRVDIYAFGVVAYEMITGHTPFHGRQPPIPSSVRPPRACPASSEIAISISESLQSASSAGSISDRVAQCL